MANYKRLKGLMALGGKTFDNPYKFEIQESAFRMVGKQLHKLYEV